MRELPLQALFWINRLTIRNKKNPQIKNKTLNPPTQRRKTHSYKIAILTSKTAKCGTITKFGTLCIQKDWTTILVTTITAIRTSLIPIVIITERITTLDGTLVTRTLTCTLIKSYIIGSRSAFILFLIYITRILVLFRYILAIRLNNLYSKITNSKKLIFYTIILLITITNPTMKLTSLTISNTSKREPTSHRKTKLFT